MTMFINIKTCSFKYTHHHYLLILLGCATTIVVSATAKDATASIHDHDHTNTRTKRADEKKPESCSKWFDLDAGVVTLTHPAGSPYPPSSDCLYTLTGHRECVPFISCTNVDIRNIGKDCKEEYFEVSDGLGGVKRICGSDKFFETPYGPSTPKAYELYVRFVSSKTTTFDKAVKGFTCTANCHVDDGGSKAPKPKPLPGPGALKLPVFKNCTCGQKKRDMLKKKRKSGRVVNGMNTAMNEFPWMTAMVKAKTRQVRCGASLINNRYILTAAHCVFDSPTNGKVIEPSSIDLLLHAHLLDPILEEGADEDAELGELGSVRAPGWNQSKKTDEDENTVRLTPILIYPHPGFNQETYDYDICLIKVKETIDISDTVGPGPVCLPPQALEESKLLERVFTLTGWGKADFRASSSTRLLQKVHLPFHSAEKCREVWADGGSTRPITDRMQCAGLLEGGKDGCTGDSGGPLFDDAQGTAKQGVQFGVVSFGNGCAQENSLGIYTRVPELMQWIWYHTQDAVWCKES